MLHPLRRNPGPMTRIVALASGKGTNFRALLEAAGDGRIRNARFVGLVVDRPHTGAERFARDAGIACVIIDYTSFASRSQYNEAFARAVDDFAPDLIVAAGYMRILDADFVRRYPNRILNIHPSLLPSFPGLHAQRQALEYGVKVSGCTVHFVDEGLDSGPIVVQRAVSIPEGADEEHLTALIRSVEHESYIEAVSLFCEGRLRIEGRRVVILKEREMA